MKILVIGKSGQISRALLSLNTEPEHVLSATGRPEVDLTLPNSLASALDFYKPELVINAGAYTAVEDAELDPDLAWSINSAGAANIARVTKENEVPLVHFSTDYVFDGHKTSAYTEDDLASPLNVYGASKQSGDEAIRRINPQHIILRTSWVYSGYGQNFVKTMLNLAITEESVNVVSDQTGNPTYANDIARACLRIATVLQATECKRPELFGTFNLSGRGATTWAEFAKELFKISLAAGGPSACVRSIGTSEHPTRAKRPKNSTLAMEKVQETFGIQMPSWRDSLKCCLEKLIGNDDEVPSL